MYIMPVKNFARELKVSSRWARETEIKNKTLLNDWLL